MSKQESYNDYDYDYDDYRVVVNIFLSKYNNKNSFTWLSSWINIICNSAIRKRNL